MKSCFVSSNDVFVRMDNMADRNFVGNLPSVVSAKDLELDSIYNKLKRQNSRPLSASPE